MEIKIKSMEKKLFRFKKMSRELKFFIEWLKWYYRESKSKNIEEWDIDESFYFDKENLELILWNEEFGDEYEGNNEYKDWIEELKNNMK